LKLQRPAALRCGFDPVEGTGMEKLFLPINIGALDLAHRVVISAATDHRRIGECCSVADFRACVRHASPGGLVITPPVPVSARATSAPVLDGFDTPGVAPAWAAAINLAHARKAKMVARLCHPGYAPVRAATLPGTSIDEVIADFRRAAEQAKHIGFDGVELDAADGSLPDQFLQDGVNRRTDRYGGSIQNRLNFLCELVDVVTGVWTAERVGVRLSPFGQFRGMSDSDPVKLFTMLLTTFAGQELPFVHLVRTAADGAPLGHLPYEDRNAAAHIRAAFPSAIIVSGAFTRRRAVELVRSRWADAIGVEDGMVEDGADGR
jgi:N-ethylmaleimide reductase